MFLKKLYLSFVILNIIFSASPAFAFGILVRGPSGAEDARKLTYTDFVIADHRDGVQKMIISAWPKNTFYASAASESYSSGISAARKALYSSRYQQHLQNDFQMHAFNSSDKFIKLDAVGTDEVFYYIIPLTRSSEEVRASLIDPAYGIAELFDSSTKPFYYPANFLILQSWQLAMDLFFSATIPYLYRTTSLTDELRWLLKEADECLNINSLNKEFRIFMPHYNKSPESIINVFECRDTSEFRQKLLANEKSTGDIAGWRFDPTMFAPYCKPGNCFVSIKCTKTTLPVVFVEFRSPGLIIPLKHLSDEKNRSVNVRLITLSPFEASNYNFEYDDKNIEDIGLINDWKKIMLDLNHLDRVQRYRKFKVRNLCPSPTYNVMYLHQTTGNKIFPKDYLILRGARMIENVFNFFHDGTPEIIIYTSLNFSNQLLDCGDDLKLEPAGSMYFKKVKFYVNFFNSETRIISLLVLISLLASFIGLAISGYVTYGDWKRHINISPFGIISPALVFIALMFKRFYPGNEFFEVLILSLFLLFASYFLIVFNGLLFAALALQVYIMFKPNFIFCFLSVIILIYHVAFAIIV